MRLVESVRINQNTPQRYQPSESGALWFARVAEAHLTWCPVLVAMIVMLNYCHSILQMVHLEPGEMLCFL